MRLRSLLTLASSISLTSVVACGGASADRPTTPSTPRIEAASTGDAALQAALGGSQRSAEDRARDAFRHPAETLAFFGARSDMTVVELWPGGGWYTEILAPYLAERGKLLVTGSKVVARRIEAEPKVFGKVELHRVDPPNDIALGPDGSADLVLTFRNVHNWIKGGYADKVFAAAARVLKKGGTLGVVEHRAKPGTTDAQSAESGYVTEERVIELAKAAGLELAGRSEVNANPKDTTDHPNGVWALPPVLKNGEADAAKYRAIGESDRMTLKFTKP